MSNNTILSKSFWLYWDKIIHLVSTFVIKSESMINYFNRKYIQLPTLNLNDPTTYPYYINLSGEYHKLNYIMTTIDFPTNFEITKSNIQYYSFLPDYYAQSITSYRNLLNRYKDQHTLLKAILFNKKNYSIEELIDLPNYSLIGYREDILDEQERIIIIDKVKKFLEYYNYRWYINTFHYEELYGLSCDSILYMLLPLVILYYKIQNIKTSYADDFHIWEYLTSKGIKNFKYYFDKNQTLFFYKNINYLIGNRGKILTTQILKDVLLSPLGIKLEALFNFHYYKLYSSKSIKYFTFPDIPEWNNSLVYKDLDDILSNKTDKINYTQSFKDFITYLNDCNLDNNNSDKYINETKNKFRFNQYNRLITKFQKLNTASKLNYKYYLYYLIYVLDNYIYLQVNNKLNFYIKIEHTYQKDKFLYIHTKDILPVIYWCFCKYLDINPALLPIKYTLHYSFKYFSKDDLILNINQNIDDKELYHYLNINEFSNNLLYIDDDFNTEIKSNKIFNEYLETNYKNAFLYLILSQRRINNKFCVNTRLNIFNIIFKHRSINITNIYDTNPSNYTYDWFFTDHNYRLGQFLSLYENYNDKDLYLSLVISIVEQLSLLNKSFRKMFYLTRDEKMYYKYLLELFEMFSSYLVRIIKKQVLTYTYKYTSFNYIGLDSAKTTYKSLFIFPDKGSYFQYTT